jgi:hypothetical protein
MPSRTFGNIATLAALSLALTSACARNPDPDEEPEMKETPVRVAAPARAVK